MGKAANRRAKRRRKAINTAGVVSSTPRLDQARQWRDEIRAEQQALAQPVGDQQHDDRGPDLEQTDSDRRAWRPPPPPWAAR